MQQARKLLDLVYTRYVAASGTALACDAGSFVLLLRAGAAPVAAAVVSYGFGILVHWYLSSRFVFAAGRSSTGARRLRQKSLFMASALVGLGLTAGIVGAGQWLRMDPLLSKLAAVVISFQATYLMRRSIVFAP